MVLASTARTDLYYASAIDEHRHHGCGTNGTIQRAGEFHNTMRAKKADHRACGDVKLGSKIVTAVQAGKPEPALFVVTGYGHPD
jgi:hypothetical protein